ncbi:hypothetical protein DFH06DRAFT_1297286 [Mycena polygramma]|nr:hypothetical protein DFH06DRAFT_1297286 [Mycena polygramma]
MHCVISGQMKEGGSVDSTWTSLESSVSPAVSTPSTQMPFFRLPYCHTRGPQEWRGSSYLAQVRGMDNKENGQWRVGASMLKAEAKTWDSETWHNDSVMADEAEGGCDADEHTPFYSSPLISAAGEPFEYTVSVRNLDVMEIINAVKSMLRIKRGGDTGKAKKGGGNETVLAAVRDNLIRVQRAYIHFVCALWIAKANSELAVLL